MTERDTDRLCYEGVLDEYEAKAALWESHGMRDAAGVITSFLKRFATARRLDQAGLFDPRAIRAGKGFGKEAEWFARERETMAR